MWVHRVKSIASHYWCLSVIVHTVIASETSHLYHYFFDGEYGNCEHSDLFVQTDFVYSNSERSKSFIYMVCRCYKWCLHSFFKVLVYIVSGMSFRLDLRSRPHTRLPASPSDTTFSLAPTLSLRIAPQTRPSVSLDILASGFTIYYIFIIYSNTKCNYTIFTTHLPITTQ